MPWYRGTGLWGGPVEYLSPQVHSAEVVPRWPKNIDGGRLSVSDRPLIRCPATAAAEGDRNVALRCEVSARPPLTALFWIIDVNGTTVTEGQVVNEYWTLVMVSRHTCRQYSRSRRNFHGRKLNRKRKKLKRGQIEGQKERIYLHDDIHCVSKKTFNFRY